MLRNKERILMKILDKSDAEFQLNYHREKKSKRWDYLVIQEQLTKRPRVVSSGYNVDWNSFMAKANDNFKSVFDMWGQDGKMP